MEPTANAPSAAPKLFGGFGIDTLLAGLFLLVGSIIFLWAAPFTYEVYLAVHVIAAVIWVGGDVTLTTLGIVFERRGEGETLGALGRMGSWIGTRVYTPTLFVVQGTRAFIDDQKASNPGRYALVLVTDGYPQGCDDEDNRRIFASLTNLTAHIEKNRVK